MNNYFVDDLRDRNLVGLRIRNTENVQDNMVGLRFRHREQLTPDVVWGVLGKVVQSDAMLGLSDRIEIHFDHVRMPAGNGKGAVKTKNRF